jgi:hypothetical protein
VRRLRPQSLGGAGPRARKACALRAYGCGDAQVFGSVHRWLPGRLPQLVIGKAFGRTRRRTQSHQWWCPNSILARAALVANRETHKDSAGAGCAKGTTSAKQNAPAFFRCRPGRQRVRGARSSPNSGSLPAGSLAGSWTWAPPWRTRRLLIGEGASVPGNALHARD